MRVWSELTDQILEHIPAKFKSIKLGTWFRLATFPTSVSSLLSDTQMIAD